MQMRSSGSCALADWNKTDVMVEKIAIGSKLRINVFHSS